MSRVINFTIVSIILYASYLLILLSVPYLDIKPNIGFLITKQFVYHIDIWRIAFYIHVYSSVFILLAGLIQFNKVFIHKLQKIHKIAGYIYIILLLFISGPGGLIMAFYANGGLAAQISFVILAVLWICFTLFALILVKQKKYVAHGKWLLRSYALTLSAITLRFYMMLLNYFNADIGPVERYILVAYLAWIPNLIIAEILIKRKFVEKILINKLS